MNQQRRQGRASILAGLLMVWVWSCADMPSTADDFERSLRLAEELTVPQGVGRAEHPTLGVERNMVKQRTWAFTTALTWDDYQRWITQQLRERGRFELRTATETALDFSKVQPGDFYQLHIERDSSTPPLHVRVTFTAMSD